MAPTRRIAGLIFLSTALVAPSLGLAEDRVGAADVSLGRPDAPVTLIEYASITCPHCARFDAQVFPLLKARYIDTGKVRYVFREVPIHADEDTAGFLIARCAGPQRYLAVTDALFRAQPVLFDKRDLHGWLMAGAAAGGLDEAQVRACISDVAAIQAFNDRAAHTINIDKIDSTPTVIVNGKPVSAAGPEFTIADIDAAIRPLLGGRSAAAPARRRPASVHR